MIIRLTIPLFTLFSSATIHGSPNQIFFNLLDSANSVRTGSLLPCGLGTQKEWIRETTEDWYLWNDELQAVDQDDFRSAQQYLNALTAPMAIDGRDPGFSYVTTVTTDQVSNSSGAYIGFGIRFAFRSNGEAFLGDVYEGGPAWVAGLRRGLQVIEVDAGFGFESWPELLARGATNAEVFGLAELGVKRRFKLLDRYGTTLEVLLAKDQIYPPAIAGEATLIGREGLTSVGYLNLRGFTLAARQLLRDSSLFFQQENVSDLIIDLRYNGGGLLSVADLFLDLLGGQIAHGQRSFYLMHNEQRSYLDDDNQAFFRHLIESFEPNRIAFITSGSTASASELIINSLAPHIEVVLIGSDTAGKSVGQYAFEQEGCDKLLRLVSFEVVNGEGEGRYYSGLADTGRFTICTARDDLWRPFTDLEEESIATALQWLNQGICPTNSSSKNVAFERSQTRGLPIWFLDVPSFHGLKDRMRR